MFVDEATVQVKAGRGGDGTIAFLREKYRPKGGPAGGDGGRGGDVVFVASESTHTLADFKYVREIKAKSGQAGGNKNCSGRSGESTLVRVPPGTIVKDIETGATLFDLVTEGQRAVVARGGKGGLGNQHFATATNQAPRTATPGEPGEERKLKLELKLIADAGLVGFPNAGKSTFISRVSAAHPKIASYPFTTLEPVLGIVSLGHIRLVLADLPGLIEGASDGAGLGHEFLRHVERTRLIVHMVDAAPLDGSDPVRNVEIIRRELSDYSADLAGRAEILVANKVDMYEAAANVERLREAYGEVFPISAVSGQGVRELLEELFRRVRPG